MVVPHLPFPNSWIDFHHPTSLLSLHFDVENRKQPDGQPRSISNCRVPSSPFHPAPSLPLPLSLCLSQSISLFYFLPWIVTWKTILLLTQVASGWQKKRKTWLKPQSKRCWHSPWYPSQKKQDRRRSENDTSIEKAKERHGEEKKMDGSFTTWEPIWSRGPHHDSPHCVSRFHFRRRRVVPPRPKTRRPSSPPSHPSAKTRSESSAGLSCAPSTLRL